MIRQLMENGVCRGFIQLKTHGSESVKSPSHRGKDFLILVLFVQIMVIVTTVLDISVARQVIGFFFFTFISGFVILWLFRIDELDLLETLLISIGFGVAFLILSGLLANELLPMFGVQKPLSTLPLLLIQSSFVSFGAIAAYISGKQTTNSAIFSKFSAFSSFKIFDIVLLVLPILSVAGALHSEPNASNLLPMTLITVVCLVFAIVFWQKKLLSPNVFPLALVAIALALLFQSSLISQNIVSFGGDSSVEYFVSKTTQNSAYWLSNSFSDIGYGRLNAMLSITILPTVYTNLLSLDLDLVYKVLYPVIFSLVPLCIYKLWVPNLGKKGAFAAAFLIISMDVFYGEMLGLARQMTAELFFCLLLVSLFSIKIKPFSKVVIFSVFGLLLVVSHYALAEIFLFFLLGMLVPQIVRKKHSRKIGISLILIFSVIMFSWYIYTSQGSVFNSVLEYGNDVLSQLDQFLNPESRGEGVLMGIGLAASPTVWNSLGRVFAYATQAFIVLGFVGLITKRTNMDIWDEKSICCISATVLLALTVLVPGLASTIGITRFYHILLFFLSGMFFLGLSFFSKLALGQRKSKEVLVASLCLLILLPYFIFQSGFVYELANSQSYSLALSRNRMSVRFLSSHFGYFNQSELDGVSWLSKNIASRNTVVISDYVSRISLQFNVYGGRIISEFYSTAKIPQNYYVSVFLNKVNLFEEWGIGKGGVWNFTAFSPVLNRISNVYSSGGCEIYSAR
jgi:uncharacterized membrane protein